MSEWNARELEARLAAWKRFEKWELRTGRRDAAGRWTAHDRVRDGLVEEGDPDLYWLEEAWCLVRDRGLLEERSPRSSTAGTRWKRPRAVRGAVRG